MRKPVMRCVCALTPRRAASVIVSALLGTTAPVVAQQLTLQRVPACAEFRSPVRGATRLSDLLLVHAKGDDNVHFQSTVQLAAPQCAAS